MNTELFDAYVAQLRAHDWYYDYSDDHQVWLAGKAAEKSLREYTLGSYYRLRAFLAFNRCAHGDAPIRGDTTKRDQTIADLRHAIAIKQTTALLTT